MLARILFAIRVVFFPLLFSVRGESHLEDTRIGPAAALEFETQHRGAICRIDEFQCYPEAKGIPFTDTRNIVPMRADLWTPSEIVTDFRRREESVPLEKRKKGIMVLLKTERCATNKMRLCSVTTAALEKQSTPLVGQFAIYGVQLKPRDGDNLPGSLKIEKGSHSWKNKAVHEYGFRQGMGAVLVFLNPRDGTKMFKANAFDLHLYEEEFESLQGRVPVLEKKLKEVLRRLNAGACLSRPKKWPSYAGRKSGDFNSCYQR